MRTGTLNKLTARGCAKAPDGMHSDGGGLFLRVKGGSRAWVFRYTSGGRKREMGLGSAASVSLATARERAAQAREAVAEGLDPIADRKPTQAAPVGRAPKTFEAAMRAYLTTHGPTWSNAKHAAQWASSLERHARPLMRMPVAEITTADVADLLSPIWLTKMETASRVRQRIERILSASIARGDRAAPNPAALRDNLEHILPAQAKLRTVAHHAAVPVEDAPAAFGAIWSKRNAGIGYQALVTLILSGLRSGEVRRLEWADLRDDHILIPAERMKARKPHRVAMSLPLAIWLRSLPHQASSPLIHPGQAGRAMSDMTMAKALRNAGYPDATPHGWRSTFSMWANAQGWSRDLIEDALAHQIGNAVERAYRRADFMERRHPLMTAWAEYLLT